jgi:protein-tyrosine phosphatase
MELYWVNDVIAVATRPRGGDWLRDDLTAAQLRGVRHVVSCLTPAEESELELENESEVARSLGLNFTRIPIEDFGIPKPTVVGQALSRISRSATPKAKVAIHCRQALGRSPLVAAAMLVRGGMKPGEAWETVAKARGRPVPETEEQREWLTRFAASESSARGQA